MKFVGLVLTPLYVKFGFYMCWTEGTLPEQRCLSVFKLSAAEWKHEASDVSFPLKNHKTASDNVILVSFHFRSTVLQWLSDSRAKKRCRTSLMCRNFNDRNLGEKTPVFTWMWSALLSTARRFNRLLVSVSLLRFRADDQKLPGCI